MRDVSPRLDRCELTHVQRMPIDGKLARKQHTKFAGELRELGIAIEMLPALPEQADGVFVEDGAVILPEVAVVARPAVASRQAEIESIAATIAKYRPVVRIVAPSSLDGGDVLRIGRSLYVGVSGRTNHEGVAALTEIVEPFGYDVHPVEVRGCLHLKTACTFVPPHFLLLNPAWVDAKSFGDLRVLPVADSEPFAANTLTVGGSTLVSAACPITDERLREAGIVTRKVDISEFHKAEAALSCLVLIVEPRVVRPAIASVGLKVIEPSNDATTDGFFAPAVVHGGVVYVSGQLPIDPATGKVISGEIEEQAEQALRNLAEVLRTSGSSVLRVLRLTFYLSDAKALDRVMSVCARTLNGHRPAGSVVLAKSLRPGCALAIDAIAAVGEGR